MHLPYLTNQLICFYSLHGIFNLYRLLHSGLSSSVFNIHAMDENALILNTRFHQKPADLDLNCFQKGL